MYVSHYENWFSFRYKGKRFLALKEKGEGIVHVYGELFANYGAYFSVDNFKKMYKEKGEELNLTQL